MATFTEAVDRAATRAATQTNVDIDNVTETDTGWTVEATDWRGLGRYSGDGWNEPRVEDYTTAYYAVDITAPVDGRWHAVATLVEVDGDYNGDGWTETVEETGVDPAEVLAELFGGLEFELPFNEPW